MLPENWPLAKTANGITIVPGLSVRDYNWNDTTVTDVKPSMCNGAGGTLIPWFTTANGGFFDGSRLLAI